MFAALLILSSTLSTEIAQSIGKVEAKRRRESVYELAFLGLFWGLVAMVVTLAFGARFFIDPASVPFMAVRTLLEIGVVYTSAEAIIQADRTTVSFLRIITIPLLLVVDIALGYNITPEQIAGVGILFVALVVAFRHNPAGKKGAGLAALSGLLAVGTTSLYKYNITNYNSVAGEQIIVIGITCAVFYGIAQAKSRRSPLKLLIHPVTGTQALANGVAIPLESFAMTFVPASLLMAMKRSFALMWSIVFGGVKFHEHSLKRKASAAALMAVSLALIIGVVK